MWKNKKNKRSVWRKGPVGEKIRQVCEKIRQVSEKKTSEWKKRQVRGK